MSGGDGSQVERRGKSESYSRVGKRVDRDVDVDIDVDVDMGMEREWIWIWK